MKTLLFRWGESGYIKLYKGTGHCGVAYSQQALPTCAVGYPWILKLFSWRIWKNIIAILYMVFVYNILIYEVLALMSVRRILLTA